MLWQLLTVQFKIGRETLRSAESYRDILICAPNLITGPRKAALSSRLADMEEAQPDWVMRIEDFLAENHLLQ